METIELIRAMGGDIVVECGDIAEVGTSERLVSVATATGLPLRGVLHAAAVFENAMLSNMTDELIDRNWAPKVYGAWNLHLATTGQPLDWFCLFSSAVALVGSPGQGPTPRPTAGWTHSLTGAEPKAFPRLRSGGHCGPRSAPPPRPRRDGRDASHHGETPLSLPDEGAYAFQALLGHDRAYTGYAQMTGTPWSRRLRATQPVR